jgi:hypothetical protein
MRALREQAIGSAANTADGPNHNEKALVMADPKLTLPRPMTVDEIRALADRLEARGTSVLMRDQPAQCADLERAAYLLRLLAGSDAVAPADRKPLRSDPFF